MSVVVVIPPQPVISLDQAKAQCNATGFDDDDALITDLMAAAQGYLDGPEGILGVALGVQTLELRLDSFFSQDWSMGRDWTSWGFGEWSRWARPSRFSSIELPCPPFISVVSVTYEDQSGADQVLSGDGWNATDEGITPAFGDVWPAGRIVADAIRIQYQAGYQAPSGVPQPALNPVPAALRRAMLMLISHWYNHRDAVVGVEARDSSTELPLGVANLIAPYRRYRV